MLYATPDERVRADSALVALALQQHALRFHHRPLRVVLILIDTALIAGLQRLILAAGAKHLRRYIHFHIRAKAVSIKANAPIT